MKILSCNYQPHALGRQTSERGAFFVANYFHFGNSWFYSFDKCC